MYISVLIIILFLNGKKKTFWKKTKYSTVLLVNCDKIFEMNSTHLLNTWTNVFEVTSSAA